MANDIKLKVGNSSGAATELKSALLPQTDGCATTGKAGYDNWVRTYAARGVLYPQMNTLIQKVQALQGS
ncbi:MAG: hypothetical protein WB581_07830 [Halobacteriota archaeon]